MIQNVDPIALDGTEAGVRGATRAPFHIIDDADPIAELATLSRSQHERARLPEAMLHAEALNGATPASLLDPTVQAGD